MDLKSNDAPREIHSGSHLTSERVKQAGEQHVAHPVLGRLQVCTVPNLSVLTYAFFGKTVKFIISKTARNT